MSTGVNSSNRAFRTFRQASVKFLSMCPDESAPPKIPMCWICISNPAETGEHWAKASNVRDYFRKPTQQQPLYLQKNWVFDAKIGSDKSKKLKFGKSLCLDCNSSRTQPYDEAWDTIFEYLQTNWMKIRARGSFNLSHVFPDDPQGSMVRVQLYFIKVFGCLVHEEKVPLFGTGFSRYLYNAIRDPEVELAFCHSDQGRKMALRSEIHVWGRPGHIDGTVWLYLFSPVGVKVFYRRKGAALSIPSHVWNPNRLAVKINQGV